MKGTLKHNRSAKFTDLEAEKLEKIMIALGTDKVSKALRWCLEIVWEEYGDKIESICAAKQKINPLPNTKQKINTPIESIDIETLQVLKMFIKGIESIKE